MALFSNNSRDLKESLDDIELQIRDNLNHYVNESCCMSSSRCTSPHTTQTNSGLNLKYSTMASYENFVGCYISIYIDHPGKLAIYENYRDLQI